MKELNTIALVSFFVAVVPLLNIPRSIKYFILIVCGLLLLFLAIYIRAKVGAHLGIKPKDAVFEESNPDDLKIKENLVELKIVKEKDTLVSEKSSK